MVKQNLCASILRGAVEAVGAAIDTGTFDARKESHLSWDTMRVDEEGWVKMSKVLDRCLADLMKIEKECEGRIEDEDYFLASYFMGTFESPPRGSFPGDGG